MVAELQATTKFFTEATWDAASPAISIIYLDSPSSRTSGLTYKVQGFAAGSNNIF